MHSQIVVFPGDSQAGSWENIRMKSKCMARLGQLFLSLYGSTAGLYLLQHSGASWGFSLPVLCRWPASVLCLMTVVPSVLGQRSHRSLPKGPQSGKLPPTVLRQISLTLHLFILSCLHLAFTEEENIFLV